MKNTTQILFFLFCFLSTTMLADAEVIYLKNGKRMEGTIIFQNEEVIVIKDVKGARFQYPKVEVDQIKEKEEKSVGMMDTIVVSNAEWISTKKVTVSLQLAGGVSLISNEQKGGFFEGDVVVGTTNLLNRRILLGGALGYHMHINQHFLPVQVRAEVPLMEGKHAPLLAAGLGYGIALDKQVKGGLYANLGVGYRCQLSPKQALSVSLYSSFQSAQVPTSEMIDYQVTTVSYSSLAYRTYCNVGLRLAIYL